jgi:hypothetical protein
MTGATTLYWSKDHAITNDAVGCPSVGAQLTTSAHVWASRVGRGGAPTITPARIFGHAEQFVGHVQPR